MLRFREEDHTYWDDEERLPSVTEIIEDLAPGYAAVDREILDAAADRGTVVHEATRLLDLGVLDWSSLDEDLHGYVRSWQAWLDLVRFQPDRIEHIVCHRAHRYAGTLDRTGTLVYRSRRCKALIDIKTGPAMRGTALQTAAYGEALSYSERDNYALRMGVHLKKEGTLPAIETYNSRRDLSIFLAMRKVFGWKHGI